MKCLKAGPDGGKCEFTKVTSSGKIWCPSHSLINDKDEECPLHAEIARRKVEPLKLEMQDRARKILEAAETPFRLAIEKCFSPSEIGNGRDCVDPDKIREIIVQSTEYLAEYAEKLVDEINELS